METTNTTKVTTGIKGPKFFKKLTSLAVITTTICLLCILFQLLQSRYAYQSSRRYLQGHNFSATEKALVKALDTLPGGEKSFFSSDLLNIALGFGELYSLEATAIDDRTVLSKLLELANIFYQLAAEINPIEVEAISGLALVEAALEGLHSEIYPHTENPYNATELYDKALELSPYGSDIHYERLEYLAKQRKQEELIGAVEELAAIYPPSYINLKDKAYFTVATRRAFKRGLDQAIRDRVRISDAYQTLSRIAAEDREIALAIAYYQAYMDTNPGSSNSMDHLTLGTLFLKLNEEEKGKGEFLKSISLSAEKEKILQKIYASYAEEQMLKSFVQFVKAVERKYSLSEVRHILVAKSFIELDLDILASKRLEKITTEKNKAERYYCQALIAEKAKDLNGMEKAIHLAIELVPQNSRYHAMLSRVYYLQEKFEEAENEASAAITIAAQKDKLDQWLFNNRGLIRLNRKEYEWAIRDWQLASRFDRENSEFYHLISIAYEKMKNISAAANFAKLARLKNPDNLTYLQRQTRLESSFSTLEK